MAPAPRGDGPLTRPLRPDPPLPPPYRWGADGLELEGIPLTEIAERFGTPVYVTSAARIRSNARRVRRAFRAVWPAHRLLYALKANPNPAIVRILAEEGCGADCSSPAEIRIARACGIGPETTLYTAAYPSEAELAEALHAGVAINLDDPALLPKLLRLGPVERIAFRVNPGATASGPEGLRFAGHGAKFGVPLARAIAGIRAARREGIDRFGLHTMPGSNVLDPRHFVGVGAFLGTATRRVARATGVSLEFVDGGGGFGVPYRPGERPLDLPAVARGFVRGFLEARGPPPEASRPLLLHEPGRYLVADSTVLLTRTTHVKHGPPRLVGVDAGMHTLLRPALYGAYHPVFAVRRGRADPRPVTLVGPICENTDVLAERRRLPTPSDGTLYALGVAGAYGFAMSSQYNTRPRPAEVLVEGGRARTIRAAERFEAIVPRIGPERAGGAGG